VRQPHTASLSLADAESTRRIGAALGEALAAQDSAGAVIWLEGELGAGKTTFVAGVLAHFRVRGPIRSPTYTLVEPYELGDRTIYHLDLYRLIDARELDALAIREMAQGILLIEWPSRARGGAPAADLQLEIQYAAGGGRNMIAAALSGGGDKLLRTIVAANPEQGGVSP
jgi:tRNA threonylcarbamoyladenosine biosynthesis protein TsaE